MSKKLKKLTSGKGFPLLILTIIVVLVVWLVKPTFLARTNIRTFLNDITVVIVMMCAVVPLLIGGGVNLGASAEAAMGSMIFAKLCEINGLPWGVALVIALLCGCCFGLIIVGTGKLFNLMPFITSLGFSSIYTGFATLWTRANNVMINRVSFLNIAKAAVLNKYIPVLFLIACALLIIYALIMKFTRFGRNAYMVGGNPIAARLAGINISKTQTILFINAGAMHVLTGIFWACQKKMGSPSNIQTLSPNFDAMSAAVLGGVSFGGGSGTIGGAFCGMLLVQVVNNAVINLGFPSYYQIMLQGAVLLIALAIDHSSAIRAERARRKAAMAGTASVKA